MNKQLRCQCGSTEFGVFVGERDVKFVYCLNDISFASLTRVFMLMHPRDESKDFGVQVTTA